MTRSLRELNRPRPIACWSQGAHHDWNGYGGRKRGSPTPDELRLQAYYALASRITSLYWFNLSLRSLVAFPDLIEPMARVGREIRMLEEFYLEGDAVSHERILRDGKPDWDLDVVAGRAEHCCSRSISPTRPTPRNESSSLARRATSLFRFRVPAYVSPVAEVFRIDADGLTQVGHTMDRGIVEIRDQASRVAIYVVAATPGERARIEARRQT